MNADIIQDLKQFIEATVSQHTASITANMATKDDIARLEQKIDDRTDEILEAIGDTLQTNMDATDRQLTDHERRITKLETHAA